MELSCKLWTTRRVPREKFPFKQNTKSFIDQAFSVKDGWILASFFSCEFMDLNFVSVHKHAEKDLGQYPAILISRLALHVKIHVNQLMEVSHVINISCQKQMTETSTEDP